MNTIKIITNNHFRNILSAHELTENELKEFDYLKDGEGSFFRYNGEVYDLGEFMLTGNSDLKEWDGVHCEGFFSGIVVKYSEDCDSVKVGCYYS